MVGCASPDGMLCSGSDRELCSSGHVSACSNQHLAQQAVRVTGSPVIPARVWHRPCVARGELQPQLLEGRRQVWESWSVSGWRQRSLGTGVAGAGSIPSCLSLCSVKIQNLKLNPVRVSISPGFFINPLDVPGCDSPVLHAQSWQKRSTPPAESLPSWQSQVWVSPDPGTEEPSPSHPGV